MNDADPPVATGIDHLILAVTDLRAAADTFTNRLGFHVGGGGVHPQFGTANRLIVLDDAYIELIAPQPGAAPQGFLAPMLRGGRQGWVGFALETADAAAAAEALRRRGPAVDGPEAGRLTTTTGHDRAWRTVRVREGGARGLPFLIRHDQRGEERRRLLAGADGLGAHPLGALSVAAITIAAGDLAAASREYREWFDLLPDGDQEEDSMLRAMVIPLCLASGTAVRLAAPLRPGAGPVAAALDQHGEGLFAVTLAVADLQGAVNSLRGRGVGVRVDEPNGVLVAAQLNTLHTHGARIGLISASARGR